MLGRQGKESLGPWEFKHGRTGPESKLDVSGHYGRKATHRARKSVTQLHLKLLAMLQDRGVNPR